MNLFGDPFAGIGKMLDKRMDLQASEAEASQAESRAYAFHEATMAHEKQQQQDRFGHDVRMAKLHYAEQRRSTEHAASVPGIQSATFSSSPQGGSGSVTFAGDHEKSQIAPASTTTIPKSRRPKTIRP